MPVLKNPRHELFAQALASGKSPSEAYRAAGYRGPRQAANRLAARPDARARIDTILEKGAKRAEVTAERVLRELAAIAFSDIRRVAEWRDVPANAEPSKRKKAGTRQQGHVDGNGGDAAKAASPYLRLVDSDRLDDASAAAIAEVRRDATGGLWIKMRDKHAALVNLGKHLGMFKERIEYTGREGGPIRNEYEYLTDEELERIIRDGRDRAGRDPAAAKKVSSH
jgi:phage terminase small subunit